MLPYYSFPSNITTLAYTQGLCWISILAAGTDFFLVLQFGHRGLCCQAGNGFDPVIKPCESESKSLWVFDTEGKG